MMSGRVNAHNFLNFIKYLDIRYIFYYNTIRIENAEVMPAFIFSFVRLNLDF